MPVCRLSGVVGDGTDDFSDARRRAKKEEPPKQKMQILQGSLGPEEKVPSRSLESGLD